MTTTTGDRLLSDYLARLDTAALRLPPDRRAELMEGIAEHIAAARASGELRDEAAVRTLIDRLGEPEEIVAAATEQAYGGQPPPRWGTPASAPPVARQPGTGLELAAVLMLTVGSLLPFVGWLVGVALLWSSRRWRVGEKLLGTLVVPGGPGTALFLGGFVAGSETCTTSVTGGAVLEVPAEPPAGGLAPPTVSELPRTETTVCESSGALLPVDLPGWATAALVAFLLLAPVVVAVVLLRRARTRAAAEAPVLRPGGSRWGGLEIAAVVVLGAGSFIIPVLGPLVALVLVWSSQQWRTAEKVLATVLTAGAAAALLAFYVVPGAIVLPAFGGFGLIGLVLLLGLGPLLAAVSLAIALSRR